jgi:molybdenum cofactor cytidylyltransferase
VSTAAPVGAIVPCAGRSSRMGRSKALLDADGSTFLERVIGTLAGAGAHEVVVVLRDETGEEAALARSAGARVLQNPAPDDPSLGGPISSVRIGLRALAPDVAGVLIHPVDHPRVRVSTVRALIDAFRAAGAPVTAPICRDRRGHPVLFAREVFEELLDPTLADGARTVVHRHQARRVLVPVNDPGISDELDTPEAYGATFSPDAPASP